MSESKTIYQKLAVLRKEIPYIQKSKKDGIRFAVVTSSSVLSVIREKMDGLGILLEPQIVSHDIVRDKIGVNAKSNKDIFSYSVTLIMKMKWINVDNRNDFVEVEWLAQADDENSSYAFGQALTYSEKNFILKYFNVPTDDTDPDIFQKELLKKVPAEPSQIEALEIMVRKVKEYTNQTKTVIEQQAKITAKVNSEKRFDDFSAYEFGEVSNILNGWVNGYEKKAAMVAKEAETQ